MGATPGSACVTDHMQRWECRLDCWGLGSTCHLSLHRNEDTQIPPLKCSELTCASPEPALPNDSLLAQTAQWDGSLLPSHTCLTEPWQEPR